MQFQYIIIVFFKGTVDKKQDNQVAKSSKAGTATGLGLAHPYNQKCTKCVDYMSDAFL